MPKVSSGIAVLDELLDGILVGDNVVLLLDDDLAARPFLDPFLASSPSRALVVVRCKPDSPTLRRLPQRSGPVQTVDAVGADLGPLLDELEAADEQVGEQAVWTVDDLSALQEHLGPDATLEVFARTCPRLYRRRSVAYWLLRRDAHDRAFLTSLRAITQVVVDVRSDDEEGAILEVLEADGRGNEVLGRSVRVALEPEVTERAPITAGRERLGDLLRSLRTDRGVGQAELARRVGISPSALSQAERGVRGLAGETLLRIWDALDVEVGGRRHEDRGYRIHPRGSQTVTQPASGLTAWQVHDTPGVITTWRVIAEPGSSGQGSPFPSKRPDAVVVHAGVFELRLGERVETLQEGDSIVVTDAAITGWRVLYDARVELLWSLVG